MPIHKVNESAVTGRDGCTLPARVLADNGITARVQIEGCGIQLRQGQIHTVASNAIQDNR
ncbi:hypothetical protein OG747_36560 [Streptomyces sp. NBC_01384]|uniref:hypothetical protein n=1 Tax=Streptomyces sp. NBC_01384 TaxID=2903847 RepID=UPI0032431670